MAAAVKTQGTQQKTPNLAETPLEEWKICIHQIIEQQALSHPEKEAVCSEEGTLSYRQLNDLTSCLAHHLTTLGIGPEILVPLCFDKSMWNVVSMLAVLKSGGAFVPLDPAAPVARLQALVRNVGATVVLCSQQHAILLASVAENIIPIDGEVIRQLPESSGEDNESRAKPDNLAYLIYTSGTTGEPKGTAIEHQAFCSGARAHGPAMLMSSESRALQFAAHTFDASLVEILTTLILGGTICIPSEDTRLNDVVAFINEMRVNWAVLTPSFIGFINPSDVPGLKTLVLAGEAMSQNHITTWSHRSLVNGYGPSECSVAAVVNSNITVDTEPTNIGHAVGAHLWVVDPDDHSLLLPEGSVGELLVQGPILARGYHNNPERTDESFIKAPIWAPPGRIYKTGDLVRQNPDGSFNFIGRKDTQVKVHGQRVELGEVEHHLNLQSIVKHGLVIMPNSGPFKGRLVSISSLFTTTNTGNRTPLNIDDTCSKMSNQITEYLAGRLPPYMVPSAVLVVNDIPMLSSGKLDRKQVKIWIENMSDQFYRQTIDTMQPEKQESTQAPSTEVEHILRLVWSHVLNLRLDQIEPTRSFLGLGGDSISAMQVKGQCAKRNISVSVQDILRSKSIKHLAQCAKAVDQFSYDEEVLERPFDLSPIQHLFFKLPGQGRGHFNQSFFLRVTRRIQKKDLRQAIETIVARHSMLRSRFSLSGTDNQWQQRITHDVGPSYRLKAYTVASRDETTTTISATQVSLDIVNGPVFAADLFNVDGDDQLLFMVAHHLVIDLVSWRVILEDLEEILTNSTALSIHDPLPFQSWCQMQRENCRKVSINKVLPFQNVPAGNAEYWEMAESANNYGSVLSQRFELDSKTTSLILTDCHRTLNTEPIDVLLSALIHSFAVVFPDRTVPAIYNEGHGRESSGMPADLSRTVGWFTIMYPVHVPISVSKDFIETVRNVKDLRRKTPDNGRPYFASRCLTDEGRQRFDDHWPLEITFNYLGQYQQLEREGALLRPVEEMAGEARGAGGTADVGHETPRFGIFEISAVIAQGRLRFSFTFNKHMKHQDKIMKWVSTCRGALGDIAKTLTQIKPQATLGDFPLLSLDYDRLKTITTERLPQIGISSVEEVEDIYPSSSMQEGLLISQNKSTAFYAVQVIYELKVRDSDQVDRQRLADAWQMVVNRHASLRTVFIESVSSDDGLYDQVVLKNLEPNIIHMDCSSDKYALRILGEKGFANYGDGRHPPHRMTICQTRAGKIFCKLEISHTIMDGGSMSIIFRDLSHAYEGLLPDGSGPLYSDYIAYLQNQPSEASVEYWKTYLAGIEPCNFPILNDGAIEITKQLRSLRLDFSNCHFSELKRFCDENGVTLSNALHTAWGLTLRCYTDSDDICFGYLTSGRDYPVDGIEEAVGPFINLLVCRCSMVPASRLGAVLDQVQKDYMDSLPHRHVSLAEVQHALKLSGTALFNTALSYRRLPASQSAAKPKVEFVEAIPIYDPTEYNLSVNIEASEDHAVIDLDYWTDCIADGQAAHIASTFIQSLQNIVHHSQQPIGQLDHLGDHSQQKILDWNSNMPSTSDECVHIVIQTQAKLQPYAPAVCGWDAEFTYTELDDLSSRLAHHLVGLGVGAEDLIPTCFDKSAWAVVAMLAVLKAGGAVVPLDATHPQPALELRVRETRAHVVLASQSRADKFTGMVSLVIPVSKEFLDTLSPTSREISGSVQPTDPSFIIFTSGSTGRPKGVVLEHRAIVTSGHATGTAYDLGPHSRVLQFATYTFDNSLAEIFITLMRGGCVCVPSEHDRFNNLAEAINKMDVNFLDITPTVASLLHPSDIPKVKDISLGGEPLTRENIEVWGKAVKLHCCYGPSECSINSTHNEDLERTSEATNIGRSIGSLSWIVDPINHDHLKPVGGVGELLIEGPILARGYINDEDKTLKAFIKDPAWAPGGNRRMYKTGDLVRYNSDGTITYLGRKDSQVKLNGQRIEVGEIEHYIMRDLPSEAQSAVELVKISNKEKTTKALAAFLCLQPFVTEHLSSLEDFLLPMTDSIRNTATDLETAMTAKLPAYMVPAIYIPLAKMPLTSSGKLDRRKLRTITESLSEEQASMYRLARKVGRAPSTEMETTLATLWEAILKLEPHSVGAEDNFFRLGGDSIEAMRLITAARSQGISLTVASVFQKPILSEMSDEAHFIFVEGHDNVDQFDIEPFSLLRNVESIDALKEEIATQCRISIDNIEDAYPTTSIQAGLVALSNKDPGAYVAQNMYRLPSDIDVARFRESWQRVVEVEVILRTRIVYTKSLGFVQVVVREPITWHTTTSLQDIVNEDRLLPAHNGGVLSRYTIVEDTLNSSFIWTAHHAIYDGWCIPLMLEKVEACYRDLNVARLSTSVSYPTFIKYLSEIDAAESDNFWKTKLSETTAHQFPQLPHPSYQVHATGLASHVAEVSREAGSNITLPSTIRAAWALVVGIYSSGSEDVVFGETLTGRDCPIQGISDMIGPTLATVPTRIRVDPKMSISRFLEEVQLLSAEAQKFQYAGLQHIKHISEDTAVACGFQNLLAIHHNNNEGSGGFWDLQSSGTVGTNFYSYPLTMSCQIGDGKVDLEAHYDQAVVSTWQVEAMLRQFEFVLESLISPENMNQTLGEMDLLNSNDYIAIKGWNREPGKKVNKCVHQLIEQQVLEQPDFAVAVDSWDAKFTYRELDELSTRLALQLVKQKVQSTLIPLCFEKSAWTVVAMLAILKSGAAFVPLDPTAPVTRLREIIADTNAGMIFCSSKYQTLCSAIVPETFIVDRKTIDQLPSGRQFRHRWDALPSCDPNAPAYVIFTSGTTGRPKGTVIQHYAFCSGAAAHGPALRMHPSSRVLQFASYTFDASLLEILTTLTIGGCVCVPSDDDRLNDITKAINELSVTWTLLTPSFIQVIQPSQVPTLRTLVLGGEAMSQTHISTWADKVELINAYGPSECAVVATVNPYISHSTDPSNMGRATGGRAWIADKHNHNRLVPIGSVGELIIEGPLLAQGYLKNDAKTAEVFIENPTWAITDTHSIISRTRRMYKTGDLVKYTADGRMLFCGRKDTQVKVHGQRLELGEVEHYLRLDPSIQHALATIPKAGFCKKRLVAVLSLQELATSNISQGALRVVVPEACSFYLTGIRERLCEHLPAYMIPSNWVVLQKLPLLPSGKLDRRQLDKWVEDMTSEVYHQISDIDKEVTSTGASEIERQLQKVWGKALNLPADQIGLHQSFLHLGGDSISAMQVMSSCRAQDLGVTVQDIIQSKSIAQLAQCVTLPEKLSYDEDEADLPFDLSPMQKLYFECVGDKWAHFNQSVVLRLNRRVDALDISRAIETIVKSHSMLRARFAKNEIGTWQQQIVTEISLSYRLDFRTTTIDLVPKLIEESQKGLDVEKGPVFAVDLVDIGDNQQLISLVAHHLVIDVVSWRIILQDLEDILELGSLNIEHSLPFQTWSRLQAEHTQQAMSKNVFLPEDVPVADLNYWGMADHQNVYGDTVEDGFELDPETSLLLLSNCHDSMETEPIDIFLATVMASFRKVFSDRGTVPAIFNEGHGREPWPGSKLDLSRTVGWFTTMCPIYLPNDLGEGDNDIVSMVRWVKDLRNRIPDKGRPYFAYRLLTEEGRERLPGHWPMEVTFNYLGKLQQLERNNGLLQPADSAMSARFDINPEVPRFALFEISAEVTHGSIKISFSYNRKMKRQAKIRRWILEYRRFLQDAAQQLAQAKPERTLSDFPLLPLSYTGMAKIIEKLPQLGVSSLNDLEDIYSCTPMQQGMLLAQLKQPDLYAYSAVFEARSTKADHVTDASLLIDAWQDVVNRHATLRTVFIESLAESGRMDQVVLKHSIARTAWLHCGSEDVSLTFAEQTPISFRDKQPPHRFSICKAQDGKVFCRLEISHVISDGTSIPIIFCDLSDAYQFKLSTDRTGSLNPNMTIGHEIVEARRNSIGLANAIIPSIGPLYSDYIAYLRSKSPDEDINYWKSYLADVEPCNFPPLTDGRKDQKELRSLVLNLSQAAQLRNFCTKNGLTLSNALQLAWALVLRSYTGSSDVCFGYLTSGRDAPIPGLQNSAVGAFINMLTFRIDLKEELPLSQALEKLQTDFVQSMAHQSCSLADVQHELQLSGTSLFNTAFTFQKRSKFTDDKQSVITFDVVDAQDPSEYDVTVNIEAFDEGIEVHFGYWSNILSESQAMNMSKTFDHVLNSIITSPKPDQTVGEIDFFSEHSLQQVMRWNQSFPSTVDRCIHDIIDEQKLGRPASTPAICAWNGDFTYAALEQVTNKLAARLVHLGVGPEIYVPLCFEKSMWTVISMIAVMKAGGAFVPLDPSHPQGRLKHFIDDVKANLVLCSELHKEKISSAAGQTLVVDRSTIEGLGDEVLARSPARPSDPAYIIFTSGTTGLPKGTIIEHAAFSTSATEHAKAMRMRSDSRVFQFASHTFDASVMEILSCLIVGGCVCIPSDQDRMNNIPGAITRMGVTWTLLTPSVANTLTPKTVPTLKVLVTGGEAMSSGHIAKWKGKICLINAYGPSETSVIATTSMKVDEDGNEICSDTSSIGRAVGGRNWIVDPRNYNKLVPVGAIGELVVEGRIVARGYLNNEQKTAQAFISHPEWLKGYEHQERMYRTGDLVRYNADGSFSFVARKDTQIKLNGQRIELGEIEHNVKNFLPEDSQSAVELVAPMSRVATKALAVFFCLDNALEVGTEDEQIPGGDDILLPMSKVARRVAKNLDSSLAGVLPTYMIPSFYIPVTKMPWTSSGKLDRTRLRTLVATLPKEATGPSRLAVSENKISTTPATVMEQKLQRLWESVMNAGPPGSVSVDDNFFRLGGDSVTAMKLVGAAKLDGISLTVIDIFRNPKLSDMASVCGTLEEEMQIEMKEFALLKSGDSLDSILDEIVEQCRIDKDAIQDAYPCSLLQEGLLTLSMKQGGAYTAHNVFRLPAGINISKFKESWQIVIDEVDILRTRIVHMESSAFIQVVEKPQRLVWEDIKSLREINVDEIKLPTHNGGCLTQYTIVDAEDSDDHFFIWSIHHALYDGWSMPMILQRVESAYLDSVSSFPKSSYASFIRYVTDMDMPASDEFWRTRLANASPLQFPQTTARADTQTRSNQMISHSISISADIAGLEVTVPTIIRAAWSMIVATYSGSNDVVFGETLAGRDIPVTGITDIIGPIFTTVPTRIQVDSEMTVAQFLKGVHQMATEIIPYQHAGLQRIKRLDSDTELACDFQNLLVIQTTEEETEDEFWTLLNDGVSSNFFTYPLVLECKASPDSSKVDINAHFDANVISNWRVERLLFQLDSVLKQLTQLSTTTNTGGKGTLADVTVFSPEDRLLVQEWNSDELRLVDSCVHEEFEEIALSQPSALALDSWDGQFTYSEVREHAMRIAHHLIGLGVGPEIVVPICMDKSAWAVISMLGVMFAGGAYCPLDPAAPLSRHQDMIQDINATLIICTPKYAERYSGLVQEIFPLDSDAVARIPIRAQQDHMLHRATSKNPIYVLFTSGSTGKPKGTIIEHRAFMTSSVAMREILLMSPTDRVFQFGSYTFDVSVLEILTTLTFGGCVCIPSEDTRTRDVAEAIVTLNINWSFLTPSVANLIEPLLVTSCLKTLVCGGEAMSLENVVKWAPHVTLVNAYGPTEASVIGLANKIVSKQRDPTNIGLPLAGNRAWIADPEDHNRITPVGSTGELLLEGPILAREYINNPEKTAAAFIENPAWTSIFGDTGSTTRRMYKTGDLVKYNEDGSFTFIGRKDNQVKLHGQRMELGEIENNLDIDPQIRHALVALPKTGHFKKRLVAVLSLTEIAPMGITTEVCQIVQEGQRGILARTEATKARNRLSERLPAYMVPVTWIVIESIPFLASGKLDRRSVTRWLETIDEKIYEQIMEADDEEDSTIPATDTAKLLQHIFSRVLNLPLPRVKLGSSFMSLGGDSITAMQVMALCRKEKINFSLSEVLRSKSIHQLAANARFEGDTVFQDEKVDQLFDLSPVQQLYFQSESADDQRPGSRFNQSFSLQITQKVEAETLKNAINTIVNQHSMLRARFVKNHNGTWQQHITHDAPSSYRIKVHSVKSADDLPLIVGQSQTSLDIQKGPLFAVDLFNIGGAKQMVFLAAHHLVIDMMSWRIILGDLEEILKTGTLTSDKPLSFQVWNSLQAENSQTSSAGDHNKVLPFRVSPVNKKYWGMDTRENTYDNVISEAFTISEETTALALGEANTSLRTEPMDIFLSAIAHSFSRVFVDRGTPPVFTEGHGRESWDASIDISRTVGWFTTIFPIQVDVETEEDDVVDTVRRMKDTRHKVPDNGRPYFAHRFLTPEGKAQFKDHDGPMEIIFNYLGRMQQLEHDDSLLQQFEYPEDEANSKLTADVGPEATRFALFEISAAVIRDKIQFSFLFNKEMKHQQEIHRWISECQNTLEETVQRLANIKGDRVFTLSDFPLLPISYDGLEKIVTKSLPQVGITHDMVEDIYPAAPLQEGLILSQIKDPSLYHFHAVFEVNPTSNGAPIDGQKLLKAWQKVVDRHGALRTVFADSVYKGDIFNQIVVNKADTGAMLIRCKDDEVLEKLSKISILDLNYQKQPRLPHQITVCEASSGKVYFKAEINHGVIDGGSANIMLRDLTAAYHDRLPDGSGPLYSDYVKFIKSQSSAAGTKFWKSYLEGARACHFPTLNKEHEPEKKLASIQMEFNRFPELQEMCKRMKVTFANVMQAAWALCLRKYTKSEDVCFGNLTSGRDVPVDGIQDTIGAFINMLVVRVKFYKQSTLKEMYQKVQSDYLQSLEHQHTQLAQIQHDIAGGKPLFNTAVSIQKGGASDDTDPSSISFDPVAAHDPGEYAVTLNVRTFKDDEGVVLRYWTNILPEDEASLLAKTLTKVLENFVNKPHQTVEELDLSAESIKPPKKQPENALPVFDTNDQLRTIISECVREIMEQMFKSGTLVSYNQQGLQDTTEAVKSQIQQPARQPQIVSSMIDYSQLSPPPLQQVTEKPKRIVRSEISKTPTVDDVEKKLLRAWSDLLQISEDSIQADDSFFQLGGDSIIAMQMVGIARDEDLALTVANIFQNPTFADMVSVARMAEQAVDLYGAQDEEGYNESRKIRAKKIQNALYQRYSLLETANVDAFLQENVCPKVNSFRGGIIDVFPVTDFQSLAITGTLMEAKWMLNYFHLSGDGPLDLKKLKQSVSRLVDSFDILRTVFVPYGNRFFQVVMRKLQPTFSVHETEDLVEFTSSLQQKDRENGPRLGESYLAFTVAKEKGSHKHRIIIRMSHAQYDGVCMPAILAALQAGYQGQKIPPTPVFSTYVRDAARRTTDDHYTYWKALLKGSSMTEVIRRRGPNYKRGGDVTSLKRIVRLSSLASDNITAATIIKAAWSLVLGQLSASSDVVFGNVISGRNAAVLGVESIVGPCVNMIPVRIAFRPGWTVLDLLHHIQDQQVANMPYESLGFREIIKHCTNWPDWTNFSTVCQHQNITTKNTLQLGKNEYTLGAVGSQEDFADLTVLSTPQGDDKIEISLIFTEGSGIETAFAEELFEALCETSTAFSADAHTALPSPSEIEEHEQRTVEEVPPTINTSVTSTLQAINRDDLVVFSGTLTRVWRQILWAENSNSAVIGLESSFFELGGDIIGLAQVASALEQEGYRLRVEDLVDHPRMGEQVVLMSAWREKRKEIEREELGVVETPQAEGTVVQKKGFKKFLGLAKKLRRGKKPSTEGEGEGQAAGQQG